MLTIPTAIAFIRKHWKLAGVAVLLLAVAYQTLTKRTVVAERNQARSTIASMNAQAKATDKRWRAAETVLASKAVKIEKDKSDEIDRISADRDALLVQLRSRPSRSTAPATAEVATNGPAIGGSTGAELFREDAQFLVGEAARADEVRVSLKACYAQYSEALLMVP